MPGLSQNAERKEKSCTSGRTGVGVGHQRAWHESTVGRLRRQVPARRKSAKMASSAARGRACVRLRICVLRSGMATLSVRTRLWAELIWPTEMSVEDAFMMQMHSSRRSTQAPPSPRSLFLHFNLGLRGAD